MKLHHKYPVLLAILLSSILLILSCSMGGSAEQGNARIAGTVKRAPEADSTVVVQLVMQDYNPFDRRGGDVITTEADDEGNYTFDNVRSGSYYLYAFDGTDAHAFLDGPFTIAGSDETTRHDSLAGTSIVMIIDGDSISDSSSGYFIKGTTRTVLTKDSLSHRFLLRGVPAGVQDVMRCIIDESEKARLQTYSGAVEVHPGDSLAVSRENRPPRTIFASDLLPKTVYLDSAIDIPIKAADPDSDTVIYTLMTTLENCSIDTVNGILNWTPVLSELRLTGMVMKISDSHGAFIVFRWNFAVAGRGTTPMPTPPDGASSCAPGETVLFTAGKTDYCSASAQYRFSWGDGDTSGWSTSMSANHVWASQGTFPVRVQVFCTDFSAPSVWSYPFDVVVSKTEITMMPSLKASIDTVRLHDTLYDVAYDSLGDTLISSPGNKIAIDTIVLRATAITCGETALYKYYADGIPVSDWTAKRTITIRPETDGIHEFSVSAWCDTAITFPSKPSVPCSVFVLPPPFPSPVLGGEFSAPIGTNVEFKFFFMSDSTYNGKQIHYRYDLIAKPATPPTAAAAQMYIVPCNTNTAVNCQDTVIFTLTDGYTGWFKGRMLYFILINPENIPYTLGVQAETVDGEQMSSWAYFKIMLD